MIYQVRNLNGHKLLERENPDEVRHFLHSRPELKDSKVWILKDYPGGLEDVSNVKDFTQQKNKR